MERFKQIDWNTALEDIIDDVFINDDRLERDSAMYRIMRDDFKDPFEDIEQDYANVNMELIKKFLDEDPFTDTEVEEEEEDREEEQKTKHKKGKNKQKEDMGIDCKQKQEKITYVPGIRKLPFNFPRRSSLSKIQHSMCLRVSLKLYNNEQFNQEEQLELESYLEMKNKILEEQTEYLNFAKSKWNDNFNWQIKCNEFVISKWSTKMKEVQKLPRYYSEFKNIPLLVEQIKSTVDESIEIKFISYLHQLGSLSKVKWPKFDRPSMLNIKPEILLNKYQCVTPNNVTQHFRLPVSDDAYCENLAKEIQADFVISSSGLKCLLNIDSSYLNSWIIPVIIKSHNMKNVVYIDKRIPPSIATIPQKNTWVYKYILRHCLVDTNNEKSNEELQHAKEDEPEEDNVSNYDIDLESNSELNDFLKTYEDYFTEKEKSENLDDSTNEINNTETNVMYKLFTIGPTESLNQEVRKHDVKEYKMLVRTKTDGIEILPNNKSQYIMLIPKMEHQLGFGAEAATFEEISYQWASLIFRPETLLARVRIAADTSEMIQIEKHNTVSLSKDMRRLYNVKIEDSLSIFHNIIEELLSLTPGRYIMCHIPQKGAFAYVYKEVEEPGKNTIDLHTICQSAMFETVPKTPWPLIDTKLTTPAIKQCKKLPAMFNAYNYLSSGRPRGRPKQTNSEVRRSVRLKERE